MTDWNVMTGAEIEDRILFYIYRNTYVYRNSLKIYFVSRALLLKPLLQKHEYKCSLSNKEWRGLKVRETLPLKRGIRGPLLCPGVCIQCIGRSVCWKI
jgi:hypothetical protein